MGTHLQSSVNTNGFVAVPGKSPFGGRGFSPGWWDVMAGPWRPGRVYLEEREGRGFCEEASFVWACHCVIERIRPWVAAVGSLPPLCEPRDWGQVPRLGDKCSCLRSYPLGWMEVLHEDRCPLLGKPQCSCLLKVDNLKSFLSLLGLNEMLM